MTASSIKASTFNDLQLTRGAISVIKFYLIFAKQLDAIALQSSGNACTHSLALLQGCASASSVHRSSFGHLPHRCKTSSSYHAKMGFPQSSSIGIQNLQSLTQPNPAKIRGHFPCRWTTSSKLSATLPTSASASIACRIAKLDLRGVHRRSLVVSYSCPIGACVPPPPRIRLRPHHLMPPRTTARPSTCSRNPVPLPYPTYSLSYPHLCRCTIFH